MENKRKGTQNDKPKHLGNYSKPCDCGYNFAISRSVIHRLCTCPICFSSYWFQMDGKKGSPDWQKVGQFKDAKEWEKRNEARARSKVSSK